MKALDPDVRRQVKKDGQRLITEPLAARMRANVKGPYAAKIAATGIRATAGSIPQVKLGGARKVFSGGAAPRDVIPGTEWGGGGRGRRGGRTATYQRRTRSGGSTTVRRQVTHQFATPRPFIYATIAGDRAEMVADWLRLVDEALAANGLTGGP